MMKVGAINNGVVIDHITAGRGMELYHFLNLDHVDAPIALIKNAPSEKMGKKDIIKIDAELNVQRIYLRIMRKNKWIDEKKFTVSIEKIYELGKIQGGLIKYYAKNDKK